MIDIEANKRRVEAMLDKLAVTRPNGAANLRKYMQNTDYYTAPGSTRNHLACEGGLCQHSLDVYDALTGLMFGCDQPVDVYWASFAGKDANRKWWWPDTTLILVALGHDLCKVNLYKTGWKNQKVYSPDGSKWDKKGNYDWQTVPFYTAEDDLPMGHGEKSLWILQKMIRLSDEEAFAIRWHMGAFDSTPVLQRRYSEAVEKYPLVLLLHTADMIASKLMEGDDGLNEPWNEPERTMSDANEDGAQDAPEWADAPPSSVFEPLA